MNVQQNKQIQTTWSHSEVNKRCKSIQNVVGRQRYNETSLKMKITKTVQDCEILIPALYFDLLRSAGLLTTFVNLVLDPAIPLALRDIFAVHQFAALKVTNKFEID